MSSQTQYGPNFKHFLDMYSAFLFTDDEIREFIGRPCSIEGLPAGYWVVKFDPQDIRFVSPEIFEAIYQEDSKGMIIEPTAPKGETDA